MLNTPLARLTLWDLLSVAWGIFLVLNVGFWVIICLYVLFGNFFALFDRAAWREPPPSPLRPPPLPPQTYDEMMAGVLKNVSDVLERDE